MAAMTTAEKNLSVKNSVLAAITMPEDAIQVGDFAFAVPVIVDGETRYGELVLTAKNNKATKTAPAYNPFDKAEEWKSEKAIKAKEKEAKEKAKAEKIAKSKKSKKD